MDEQPKFELELTNMNISDSKEILEEVRKALEVVKILGHTKISLKLNAKG